MCKAEEMARKVEAMRRQKMTQGEIDAALMEYIGGLEKQRDELLSAVDKLRKVKGRYHTEQVYNELISLADLIMKGGE